MENMVTKQLTTEDFAKIEKYKFAIEQLKLVDDAINDIIKNIDGKDVPEVEFCKLIINERITNLQSLIMNSGTIVNK